MCRYEINSHIILLIHHHFDFVRQFVCVHFVHPTFYSLRLCNVYVRKVQNCGVVYSIQYTRYRAPPVCSAWPRMKEGTEPGAAPSKAEEKVSVLRAVNRPKPPWPWPLQEDRQCWLVGSSNKEKALGKAFSSHYETAKSRWQLQCCCCC